MRFELKAVNADGRVESLDLQGLDRASAVQQAESRGYTVLAVRARARLRLPWVRPCRRPAANPGRRRTA